MNNRILPYLFIFLFFFCTTSILAQRQVDLDQTVQLEISIDEANNQAMLSWDNYPNTDTYLVFRRNYGSNSWGQAIAILGDGDTTLLVDNFMPSELYEFKVSRSSGSGFAEGYISTAFNYEHYPFDRGLILIYEATLADSLSDELQIMVDDLHSEGWQVYMMAADKADTPQEIKEEIQKIYTDSRELYTSILLFGNIPVPYSGIIGPDGHSDHIGAWPCDAYYGEIDGIWTDDFANNVSASSSRLHNIPGDGKFDQSTFVSDIDLAVGRVDFSDLPLFEASEIELLRRYINKNHLFRKGEIKAAERGLIENNFNLAEGFGQSGIKNFTSFFGRDSVHFKDYDLLKSESYLWSYGAGGGNFQGASGISNTTSLSQDSLQTVFTMLFGSYFGDWDSSNNFLRSALASGTCLSNAWAGRPVWMFHPMGIGFTLGDCTLKTQNNFNEYVTGFGARQIHIALMGDPSLKMYYPVPASKLTAAENSGHVNLEWSASPDTKLSHYFVYRQEEGALPQKIALLDRDVLQYTDSCRVNQEKLVYYVAAAQLKKTASGSFYNLSAFVMDSISIDSDLSVTADFNSEIMEGEVAFTNTSSNSSYYLWDFGDGTSSTELNPVHNYQDNDGEYQITLVAGNDCFVDTISMSIVIIIAGLDEISAPQIKLFPNPVENQLSIDVSATEQRISSLAIYDFYGRLIYRDTSPENIVQLDTEKINSGVYLLKLEMDNQLFFRSFIKI